MLVVFMEVVYMKVILNICSVMIGRNEQGNK